MSEPLDLGWRHTPVSGTGCDACTLLAEVERLRAELARHEEVYERDQKFIHAQHNKLARQAEQIAAVRALCESADRRSSDGRGRRVNTHAILETLDGAS